MFFDSSYVKSSTMQLMTANDVIGGHKLGVIHLSMTSRQTANGQQTARLSQQDKPLVKARCGSTYHGVRVTGRKSDRVTVYVTYWYTSCTKFHFPL